MNRISLRSLNPPLTGRITYAGFLSPDGKAYPINDTDVHAEWMLDNYDWIIFKGAKLDSTVILREMIAAGKTAEVRDGLVRQGWVAVHTPQHWIVGNINNSNKIIEDAILSKEVDVRSKDYPIEIYDMSRNQQFSIDEDELKERGIVSNMNNQIIITARKMEEFIVNSLHSQRMLGGETTHWANFDVHDISRDKKLDEMFKFAMVANNVHLESAGLYKKQLSSPDQETEYVNLVNSVVASFKEIPKDGVVSISIEGTGKRRDRFDIFISKLSYE